MYLNGSDVDRDEKVIRQCLVHEDEKSATLCLLREGGSSKGCPRD